MTDLTREDLLDIMESSLQAQLRAIRSLSQPKAPRADRKRISNVRIVEDILKEAGRPLHISDIINLAQSRFHRSLHRDSLVSALTKKVRDQQTFSRVAPNTFALRSQEDRP